MNGQRDAGSAAAPGIDDGNLEEQLDFLRDVKRQLMSQMRSMEVERQEKLIHLSESVDAFFQLSKEAETRLKAVLTEEDDDRETDDGIDAPRAAALLTEVYSNKSEVGDRLETVAVVDLTTAEENDESESDDNVTIVSVLQQVLEKSLAKSQLAKDQLECIICKIVTRGSIFQCQEGHIVCDRCKGTVRTCPMRCGNKCLVRNRIAESIVSIMDLGD